MATISEHELTPDEQKRLNGMLKYFGNYGFVVRVTFLPTKTLVEVLDKEATKVLCSGDGFILDDAVTDLINNFRKVGFF